MKKTKGSKNQMKVIKRGVEVGREYRKEDNKRMWKWIIEIVLMFGWGIGLIVMDYDIFMVFFLSYLFYLQNRVSNYFIIKLSITTNQCYQHQTSLNLTKQACFLYFKLYFNMIVGHIFLI